MRTSNFDKNEDIYLDVTNPDFSFFDFTISQKTKENLNKALNYLLDCEYETFYKLFDDKLFSELKEDLLLDYLNEIKTDAISIFEDGFKLFIHDEPTLSKFFEKTFIIQYTDLRLEKYNGLLQDVVTVMIDDRPYKETLEFIKSQIKEFDKKIDNSLMSGKDPDVLQSKLVQYLNRILSRLELNLKQEKPKIEKEGIDFGLSAFEIALRHYYLVKGKIEPWINARQVGLKYVHLRHPANIQTAYLNLDNKIRTKEPNIDQLEKVKGTLSDFPEIQKMIINDIENIS